MSTEPTAKAETELWQILIQRKEAYAQSLARLDELVLDIDAMRGAPPERQLVEEVAELRRVTYAEYRKAMDELAGYNRK